MPLTDFLGRERSVLTLILVTVALITIFLLSEIMGVVFFAITLGYVLYPGFRYLKDKGLSDRQSAGILALLSFLSLGLLSVPFLVVLYRRRDILIEFISALPQRFSYDILSYTYTIETNYLITLTRDWVSTTAVNIAQSIPSLSLQLFLLVFLVYAIVRHARKIEDAVLTIIPGNMKSSLYSYNRRIEGTLYGIYLVQLATAVLTFFIALPVFYLLGYPAFISLSLFAGVLQFVPVVGPSLLVILLSIFEYAAGNGFQAYLVLLVGLLVVAVLPDAVLRPRMAGRTTGLPASLYFAGFVGGVLTMGPIGVLAGPLLIALLLETIEQLCDVD